MLDLLFRLCGWVRPTQYRYGKSQYYLEDLERGDFQPRPPSVDSVRNDYFSQNSPSARKGGSQYDEQFSNLNYRNGEEEAAANGLTFFVSLVCIGVVGLLGLYAFNPGIKLLVDKALHH
jgi:hypothetical protein